MTELTGRHVALGTVAAFGVIVAVNMLLAWKAIATFPGLEVANGYIASQTFDAERRAQQALGWTLAASHTDGTLRLHLTDAAGVPVRAGTLTVLVGRPTAAAQDQHPVLAFDGSDWTAPLSLARGRWMLLVEATAPDGTRFRQRLDLVVRG
jgi:nitrogen fixation protein FixH